MVTKKKAEESPGGTKAGTASREDTVPESREESGVQGVGSDRGLDAVLQEVRRRLERDAGRSELLALMREAMVVLGRQWEVGWREAWTPQEFFTHLETAVEEKQEKELLQTICHEYERVLYEDPADWKAVITSISNKLNNIATHQEKHISDDTSDEINRSSQSAK